MSWCCDRSAARARDGDFSFAAFVDRAMHCCKVIAAAEPSIRRLYELSARWLIQSVALIRLDEQAKDWGARDETPQRLHVTDHEIAGTTSGESGRYRGESQLPRGSAAGIRGGGWRLPRLPLSGAW